MELSIAEKSRLKEKYGPWAIITGASSGIGFELARQLASAGLHLLITARSEHALQQQANDLTSLHGIKVRVVIADASKKGVAEKIISAAKGINVGLLIVAAGFGSSGLFTDSQLDNEINMLTVNCTALLELTHHYSRVFVQQKKGGIILMSSMVAFQGVPYAAHYAATKAFTQSLAEGLAVELKPFGVDVLAAAPGPVDSAFGRRANMKMSMSLLPSEIGIPILRAVGRRHTVLPGRLTKLLVYALRTLPRWGKIRVMAKVMSGMTRHQRGA